MNKHNLLIEFLRTWPIERLRKITLEEYTNLNKSDSFCYWLEQRTNDLGGITGGSSFKFGIYKRNNTEKEISTSNGLTDGEYAWFDKYGQTRDEAFEAVREIIIQIAQLATDKEFDKIEQIDLGESTKWKIAFMYSDYQLINTFSKDMVCSILDFLQIKYSYDESRFSLSNKILSQKKDDEDYFDFGSKFWNEILISQTLKKILVRQQDRLNSYFEIMDQLVEKLSLEPNSDQYYFNYDKKENRLVFTIGQRYIWRIEKDLYKYISLNKSDDVLYEFSGSPEAYTKTSNLLLNKNLIVNEILEAANQEIKRTTNSSFKKNNKKDLQELVFNKDFRERVFTSLNLFTTKSENITNKTMIDIPLNQILYGPPGTGKTYSLKRKFFDLFTVKEDSISRDQFLNELVKPLSWWQVITLVLIDLKNARVTEIYDHELIKIKESHSSSKTIVPTIWGQLQAHTVNDCPNVNVEKRQNPLYFSKDKNSIWTIDIKLVEELYPEIIEIFNSFKNFNPSPNKLINNYEFVTFHQSFTYEDFIEGIKPDLENEDSELKYKIEDGIFKRVADRAKRDPFNKYALFIDEINRGNVSQIFGELITLIEEDKRLGNDEAIEVTLPYSKEKFGVPSNLYIIGTMNTADRSVEALDTALRRRFVFEEMPPKYGLEGLQQDLFGFTASHLLETINKRIEKLLDKDHQIGHAYFINKNETTIIDSFYKNIIPLLQEYFFGDYGKIGLVLGAGFIKKMKQDSVFANFEHLDYSQFEEKESYEIINHKGNPENFGDAIKLLMNQ
ncbi:McrB family protein [Empedobacter falsenii]|uniref:McrB family protein n=1 Tax=Empedobacter falsenii TaxID=343874 RepID=UPI003A8047C0